jgi:hypothetical protein
MKLALRIDPGPAAPDDLDLFAGDGEFSAAIAGLAATTDLLERIPDAVFLGLYAYEFVERCREAQGAGWVSGCWRIPFWPGALFAAADLTAHPWRELEAMLPAFTETTVAQRPETTVAAETRRVLGALRVSPGDYCRELLATVERRGWRIR